MKMIPVCPDLENFPRKPEIWICMWKLLIFKWYQLVHIFQKHLTNQEKKNHICKLDLAIKHQFLTSGLSDEA